jgi:hypothetical protein
MIATTNMVLLASVLASAGLFAAIDSAPRKDEAPATFSERFPRPEEMFKPLVRTGATQQGPQVTVNRARKGDKIVGDNQVAALGEFCAEQQWPYIAPQCLQRTGGAAMRWPTRTITIEVRNDGGTTLEKAPIETVALR